MLQHQPARASSCKPPQQQQQHAAHAVALAAAAGRACAGVSLQANTQALMSLAGFGPDDVLLTAWNNDTFR